MSVVRWKSQQPFHPLTCRRSPDDIKLHEALKTTVAAAAAARKNAASTAASPQVEEKKSEQSTPGHSNFNERVQHHLSLFKV